jgi:sRNA-binding protein
LQGSEAARTLARYPAAFHATTAAVRPLKIGIDHDIEQALNVAPAVVREVLRGYTRRRAYHAALAAPGAMHIDLHGQPVAPVALEHQRLAQQGTTLPPSRRAPSQRLRRLRRSAISPRICRKETSRWP